MTVNGAGLRTDQAVSAGGVVTREGEQGTEVLLCGRSAERLWALPKGTPEPGESLRETAIREVREETGLGVEIVDELGTIEYWFSRPAQGVRFEKTVHHFLMRATGLGDVSEHDHEYDEVVWFPAGQALRIMTYHSEADVVQRALDALARRPARSGDGP